MYLVYALIPKIRKNVLDYASANGHVEILDWWKASRLELEYTEDAIYWACTKGHVAVMDWWKASGLELNYRCQEISNA